MDVFISYSHEDEGEAREIKERLSKKNITSFLAPKDLKTGDTFEDKIKENLRKCKAVFLLLTPNSLGSEWVITEWGAAWALGRHIFPILLRCNISDLPDRLKRLQSKDYHKLDHVIREYEEKVGIEPPPRFPLSSNRGTLIFDIDGTLLKSNETFKSPRGEKLIEILRMLIEEGYKVVLITGNDYSVQRKKVLSLFIERRIANDVFCFSDGGSRAFEFDISKNDYMPDDAYAVQNLISENQLEAISSAFYALIDNFVERNDTLLIPNIDFYERTLNYLDLIIHPIRPSFRKSEESYWKFINEIREICNDRTQMESTTFEVFADPSFSEIIIRAHGQEPELDASKLQGLIFRKLLRKTHYSAISKPELERRGGDVTSQIALKPFNEDRLRSEFRKLLIERLTREGRDEFSILTGGKTTIDIQLKGVNKTRAIDYLVHEKNTDPEKMIYFGDEFNESGNDLPVAKMDKKLRPAFIINVGKETNIP